MTGVPLRDHDVRFPISPEDAATANREHRARLAATVNALEPAEWAVQSRCSAWTVQGVVRHLTQINELMLRAFAAARSGERFTEFHTFDPKASPVRWLEEAGPEEPAASAAAYATTTQAIAEAADEFLAASSDALAATPAGRQPWPRALLHALFDTAVHERDILVPLGRRPEPAPSAIETTAAASYQVLLSGRILAVLGAPADIGLRLDGGPDLRLRVDGPLVALDLEVGDAPVVLTGEVDAVLDAMAGRGELSDALAGPAEAVGAFGALRSLL